MPVVRNGETYFHVTVRKRGRNDFDWEYVTEAIQADEPERAIGVALIRAGFEGEVQFVSVTADLNNEVRRA